MSDLELEETELKSLLGCVVVVVGGSGLSHVAQSPAKKCAIIVRLIIFNYISNYHHSRVETLLVDYQPVFC